MRAWKSGIRAIAITAAAAGLAWSGAGLAQADNAVKAGVDAWSAGDYDGAIAAWRPLAQAGDPDAQFNLAQAYRLGRGVRQDLAEAERLYALAARQGHLRAADTYGLMLFQDGRREAALPFVQSAARRGDPRSQYLLGVAHFNGDLVEKDWVRAYALLTLANAEGLPQARGAIAQMDGHIAMDQRQQAAALAERMRGEADAARARELASAELARGEIDMGMAQTNGPQAGYSPSVDVSAARDAVARAAQVTGGESPAEAGADFARPTAMASAPPPEAPVPAQSPPPSVAVPAPSPAPTQMNGPWKVQLGAFSVRGNAERLWSALSSRSELAGAQRLLVPAGRVTKLQAGGFASQSAAQSACNALKRSGQDCLVTR
jgi:TPR repeat protein